jgi:hypothetical protein
MNVIELGIVTEYNDEHRYKQKLPMDVIEFGIATEYNDEHW